MEKTNRLKKIAGIAVAVLLVITAIVLLVGFSTYTQKWEGSLYYNGTWQEAVVKIKDTRFHQWFGPFDPETRVTSKSGEELLEPPFVGNTKKLFSALWVKQEQEKYGWNYRLDHAHVDYYDLGLHGRRTGLLYFSEPDFSENLLLFCWKGWMLEEERENDPSGGTVVFLSDKASDTFLSEVFECMEAIRENGPAPDELELVKQAPRGN